MLACLSNVMSVADCIDLLTCRTFGMSCSNVVSINCLSIFCRYSDNDNVVSELL